MIIPGRRALGLIVPVVVTLVLGAAL